MVCRASTIPRTITGIRERDANRTQPQAPRNPLARSAMSNSFGPHPW
jgi:hypothetical protein